MARCAFWIVLLHGFVYTCVLRILHVLLKGRVMWMDQGCEFNTCIVGMIEKDLKWIELEVDSDIHGVNVIATYR